MLHLPYKALMTLLRSMHYRLLHITITKGLIDLVILSIWLSPLLIHFITKTLRKGHKTYFDFKTEAKKEVISLTSSCNRDLCIRRDDCLSQAVLLNRAFVWMHQFFGCAKTN